MFIQLHDHLQAIYSHTGLLINSYPHPTEKTIERSPLFVRRGGHCCRGDLVRRKTF